MLHNLNKLVPIIYHSTKSPFHFNQVSGDITFDLFGHSVLSIFHIIWEGKVNWIHVDNESEDPDYKPPLDLNGLDDTTPRHAYNLRPRRCKFTNPSSQIACFVLSSLALICYCFLC